MAKYKIVIDLLLENPLLTNQELAEITNIKREEIALIKRRMGWKDNYKKLLTEIYMTRGNYNTEKWKDIFTETYKKKMRKRGYRNYHNRRRRNGNRKKI